MDILEQHGIKDDVLSVEEYNIYHENGSLWITGYIAIPKEDKKHLFDTRTINGRECCRIHLWKKYFDNNQLAWTLDYGNGKINNNEKRKEYRSYRKDGSIIDY